MLTRVRWCDTAEMGGGGWRLQFWSHGDPHWEGDIYVKTWSEIASHVGIWRKSISGRGISWCRGWKSWECAEEVRRLLLVARENWLGRKTEEEAREYQWLDSLYLCLFIGSGFHFESVEGFEHRTLYLWVFYIWKVYFSGCCIENRL